MKTHILNLIILFTILSPSLDAQEDYPLLQELEENKASIRRDDTPKSYRIRKNQRVKMDNSIFNDCSHVTRSDYPLPDDYTSRFVLLPNGHSFTGTKKGIKMWDNYTIINISTENSKIPENKITALALDDDDQLWIGTAKSGIVIGIGDPVKPFRPIPVQSRDRHIRSIYSGEGGLVWVAYTNGSIECFLNGISCTYFPALIGKINTKEEPFTILK